MEQIYYIEGLTCANCANIIEHTLNELEEVEEAHLEFINKRLIIKGDVSIIRLQQIVDQIEDGVTLSLERKVKQKTSNLLIYRIVSSTILLVLASILNIHYLYYISFIIVAYDVLFAAIRKIGKRTMFDEKFLMSIATIGAIVLQENKEAVLVMLLYQVGEFFQDLAVDKSRQSIAQTMNIRPDFARLVLNSETKKVSPQDVLIGQIIEVLPGERIPLDGNVMTGTSSIDVAALTGESMPLLATIGDAVLSGSINLESPIKIQVSSLYCDSTVMRILDMVEHASSKKSKSEQFITRFARIYTPIVVGLAIIVAFVVPLIMNQPISIWSYRALIFLVISCPCALVISVPITFYAGIGGIARHGALLKGGQYIETLSHMDTLIFDKTGTITEGKFSVQEIVSLNKGSRDDVLYYGAMANYYSNHPIALSIIESYKEKLDKQLIEEHQTIIGKGVYASVKNKKVLVGNLSLMQEYDLHPTVIVNEGTCVYVAVDHEVIGLIKLNDQLKSSTKEAIKQLKELGIKNMVIFSGDQQDVVDDIAKKTGIQEAYGSLLPNQKVEMFERIKNQHNVIGFVGDGINDAPVLVMSDVGIAMGGIGQDAAIEAADVVLMSDDLTQLVQAVKAAKKTLRIAKQNIGFALSIKFIFLSLSLFGIMSMWFALFADVGVSLLATLNATRARS